MNKCKQNIITNEDVIIKYRTTALLQPAKQKVRYIIDPRVRLYHYKE